jgi:NADH:ubiquinone oxidoreductase subunit D
MLRGSGVSWDLRKNQPYEIYNLLKFNVPIGYNGDCFDRYLVRIEEMRQSIILIMQCLQNIPLGLIRVPGLKAFRSTGKSNLKNSMEALIEHFKAFTGSSSPKPGNIYLATEAPKGEFGIFFISKGTLKPFRCKIKAPGFLHLQGLDLMTKNHLLADAVTVIGTQDIVFGEVDR